MIASLSGVRGVLNRDITLGEIAGMAERFSQAAGSERCLIARDTRRTSPAILKAAASGLMSRGATVIDYGVISTPALFRESRELGLPAVMVTASHNEPEYNGVKFILNGAGIGRDVFDSVMSDKRLGGEGFGQGSLRGARHPVYVEDLVERFGEGSFEGVKVAVDLGGGAAISHTAPLLRRLGCDVSSVNDSYGIFTRRVDPLADDLQLLRRVVREKRCDIGLAFDCDGDRLAIVDNHGGKRTGDYMLTLALSELLAETGESRLVVSVDTTQAVDDIAAKHNGRVFRAPVGEANVVGVMKEREIRLGGEGSSGGLIDGSFNHCRDSMLAALSIIRGLQKKGPGLFDSVPSYYQERVALRLPKAASKRAMKKLSSEYGGADQTDGVKISLDGKAWVLIRPSGTEDVVRVSAEAKTSSRASQIAKSFANKLKGRAR